MDQPVTYWRRRAVTLVAGLGLLGLLAWAFSGGGGKPPGAAATPGLGLDVGRGLSAARPAPSATSSAGVHADVPGLTSPEISGLPSAAASGSSSPAAKKPAANANRPVPGRLPPRGQPPAGRRAARPSAVVLSLFGSQASYRSGQDPKFNLDAVSTAPGMCTFDVEPGGAPGSGRDVVGPCHLGFGRLRPRRPDRAGQAHRGVPVQESFAWNRTITLPGCVTLASSARPGTYTAQVRAGLWPVRPSRSGWCADP